MPRRPSSYRSSTQGSAALCPWLWAHLLPQGQAKVSLALCLRALPHIMDHLEPGDAGAGEGSCRWGGAWGLFIQGSLTWH